jgi:hypothetical protein
MLSENLSNSRDVSFHNLLNHFPYFSLNVKKVFHVEVVVVNEFCNLCIEQFFTICTFLFDFT